MKNFWKTKYRASSAKSDIDSGQQMVTAVCPLGLNQVCHLTGHSFVTVSETRDSKGTVYHPAAVLSPNEPGMATTSAIDIVINGKRNSNDVDPPANPLDAGRCSLAALARHGKKYVAVALRGQIWFAELGHHPSSEVCCRRQYPSSYCP